VSFFSLTDNGPQIAAGGQISRFQVLSSFAVQDYEKAVNKASSPAGSNVLLGTVILSLIQFSSFRLSQ
jgi:hypothetical protein